MHTRLGLVVLLLPSAALAAPPTEKPAEKAPTLERDYFFSMPMLFGADAALTPATTSTGFFWGWRPELIFGWREHKDVPFGFGFGPYANIVGSTGTSQAWLGGGATAVGYLKRFGVAASAGLDCDWLRGVPNASPVLGLFMGFRTAEMGALDLPFGVRVDYHPAVGDVPTTLILSAQLDVPTGGTLLLLMRLARAMHGFD